jgi:hypothetical protein
MAVQEFYNSKIQALAVEISEHKRRSGRIAGLRLLTVIAAALTIYFVRNSGWEYIVATVVAGLTIFLWLVAKSVKLKNELANLQILLWINEQELMVVNGHYNHRPQGTSFQPAHHAYAHDLDIFGQASLFQYLHRTTSEQGNQLLADWLLQPADAATIIARQQAAKELRDKVEWRQQLQAQGHANAISTATQISLSAWISQPKQFAGAAWKIARFVLPAISLTLLALYIFDVIAPGFFWLGVLVFFALSGYISKLATPQYVQLSKHITQLETLSNTLQWIEAASFTSSWLIELQQSFTNNFQRTLNSKPQTRNPPSAQVKSLKRILDRMDYRLNPLVFVPLNIFLFWDLQQVLQLERWKSQQQQKINHWFEVIAEVEALSSLANLSFNNPHWTFPIIRRDWFALVCKDAGHPLISSIKSVLNDFNMQGHPQLAFITGSNMAGKSTFLRTIGTNLVLAMAGAPVCASQFETPVLRVMTSMRIADNLEESASTFYAELQKLKMILDAVKEAQARPRVFLLLDEILRGTNSLDRHTGSEALIKQLIKEDAVGMIASHDLSLTQLQEAYPGIIHNYHFDVTIEGSELHFDYKLKQGVCKTLNATLLMKKIGIEI